MRWFPTTTRLVVCVVLGQRGGAGPQSVRSQSVISRIRRAFGLQRHRAETFQISADPYFIEKVRDGRLRHGAEYLDRRISRILPRSSLPLDFVSTHQYPNDPPLDRVSNLTEVQLSQAERNRLQHEAQDVYRCVRGKPLYYTELHSSSDQRDPLHDDPYAAAFIVKTVLDMRGLVSGYSFWFFSDIFDETAFPAQPFHGGFGLLNFQGIPKPSYRAFQLLHQLGQEWLLVDGLHPTINAWVNGDDGSMIHFGVIKPVQQMNRTGTGGG